MSGGARPDPEQVVRDLVRVVWNGGDLARLADFYAPRFEHDGAAGTLEELAAWHESEARTWADLTYEVLECVATDRRVALRWSSTATLVGDFGPVTGAGQRVAGRGCHFFELAEGRIVRVESLSDVFGKATQLGVRFLPPAPGD